MSKDDMKYTRKHEWIKMDGDVAVMGITDHAQSELGDITYVELPATEREIAKGEAIAVIESVKAASDVYAPVSGVIKEVNRKLEESPELLNSSPYDDGWICRMELKDNSELEGLMDGTEYEEFLKGGDR